MSVQLEIPGVSPFNQSGKHYHVSCNMVSYMPEGDIMCADTVQDAVEFFLSIVKNAQEECADECGDCTIDGDPCEWCDLSREIDTIISAASDGTQDLQRRVMANGGYSYIFTPPEGADICYWINAIAESSAAEREGKFSRADICWLHMDQEGLLPFEYIAEHQNISHHYWGAGHYLITSREDGKPLGMASKDGGKWWAYTDYLPPVGGGKRNCVGESLPTREEAARALWVAYKGKQEA